MSRSGKRSLIQICQANIKTGFLWVCSLLVGVSGVYADAGADYLVPTALSKPPSGAKILCETYHWACASSRYGSADGGADFTLLTKINSQVNHDVREISDLEQYRKADFWTLPSPKGGDCEDFALMKKNKLIRGGVEPSRLLIATVLDKNRRPHAVLVYRGQEADYVLDNATDRILKWRSTGYIFLRMQDPTQPSRWIGGFLQS